MGHYVMNHIYKGMAFTAVVLLVLFWLGYHGVQWLLNGMGRRGGSGAAGLGGAGGVAAGAVGVLVFI